MEKMLVNGVSSNVKVAQISVLGLKDEPGTAAKLFGAIADKGYNVELILQSIGRESLKDISFVVNEEDADSIVDIVIETFAHGEFEKVNVDKNIGIVSIKGAGMMSNPGAASMMFEALYGVGINIEMIYTSEIKVTTSVKRDQVDRAVAAIRNKFVDID